MTFLKLIKLNQPTTTTTTTTTTTNNNNNNNNITITIITIITTITTVSTQPNRVTVNHHYHSSSVSNEEARERSADRSLSP